MGRNYFQLCNMVLELMFYTPARTFIELETTTEGRLVKQMINSMLREICTSEQGVWKFRECVQDIFLVEGKEKYRKPDGFIITVVLPDKRPLLFQHNWETHKAVNTVRGLPAEYWLWQDHIYLYPIPGPQFNGQAMSVFMLTNCFAKDERGNCKSVMELETDEPIIPDEYRELLVYGVCKDLRTSVNDEKSAFYERKYRNLYNTMAYNMQGTKDYLKGPKIQERPHGFFLDRTDSIYRKT